MNQLPRYSIKTEHTATGIQVGMAADPAGEFVRIDELHFFVTQFFGKRAMDVPASFPEEKAETAPAEVESGAIPPAKKPPAGKKVTRQFKTGKFDQTEIDFLTNNHAGMTSADLAVALNRPVTAISTKLWNLKLKAKPVVAKHDASVDAAPAEEPAAEPEPPAEFDPTNPFIRQIPESAKPGSGRQVSWS